jgi:DnaK suppressor protein
MQTIDIGKYRRLLEARVVELDRSTRQRDVINIENGADSLDRRLRAVEREFAGKQLETEYARLREARAAIYRIEGGTYGACMECEEAISSARLAALPWAALCIRCQESVDCRCGASSARPALAKVA